MEIGNLPGKEFRIIIVKIIQDLGKNNRGKYCEDKRNVYQRLRRTKEQTVMKNTQGGIISKITNAKEYISDLQDRTVRITVTEKNLGKKRMENKKKMKTAQKSSGTTLNAPAFTLQGYQEREK